MPYPSPAHKRAFGIPAIIDVAPSLMSSFPRPTIGTLNNTLEKNEGNEINKLAMICTGACGSNKFLNT